jgi:hypothetical protein
MESYSYAVFPYVKGSMSLLDFLVKLIMYKMPLPVEV